jgi:two-component system, OmpR family, response regulator MprA
VALAGVMNSDHLPRSKPPAREVQASTSRVSNPSPKCILVVDDEDAIRDVIAETLELEGYRVEKAADGNEALAVVKATQPDAIVLDLMMPGMDGWTFLTQCRKDDLCGCTPVMVMSAYRKLSEATQDLHVQACLEKPFDLDVFLKAIERLLLAAPLWRTPII